MASVIVKIKIMPESIEADLEAIFVEAKAIIDKHGTFMKKEILPVAYGIKAVFIEFMMNEAKGTDIVEDPLRNIPDVQTAEIVEVRRALG